MRSDSAYLMDIAIAAEQIATYVAGMDRDSFLADRRTQDAVVRQMEIVGEATSRISQALRDANPEVPWRDMARARNFYVHAYHAVNYGRVWSMATRVMPRIAAMVGALIARDAADGSLEPSPDAPRR